MQIRPITSSDEAFSDWYDVYVEAHTLDYPNGPRHQLSEFRVMLEGDEYGQTLLWLAGDGGDVLGAASLGLPQRDNLKLSVPEIWVRPHARRRGIGSALLRVVEDAAAAHHRSSLLTDVEGPSSSAQTPGTLFARQHGFTHRITEIARVQRAPFDVESITEAEQRALPYAAGYQIRTWRNVVPDEHVAEYARLEARLIMDAPLGELDYEAEDWDPARIRQAEQRRRQMRRGEWNAVAMAPDGSMAGLTRLVVSLDSDETGFQDTTLVDPAHRGRRLGLLLKAANFRALLRDRPGVRAIWTWNAESNSQMIGINEILGYRIEGWMAGYQRDL